MAHDEFEEESAGILSFRPPVYLQRYETVLELSRKLKPKKVIDLGCAECKLLKSLKFHKHIQSLIGIDINASLLRSHQHLVQPLITDYLIRRPNPLTVQLFKGSIDEFDSRLLSCDLLSCIEVIEHLHAPVLEKVPAVIFQRLRPTVVIVSTPNSDFNVFFRNLIGFRHWDHKFEWNRQEFQSWCLRICSQYDYTVEFSGVGLPPPGMDRHGYCSQIAVFTRNNPPHTLSSESVYREDSSPQFNELSEMPYELIYECEFPYEINPPTPQERLSREAQYYLRILQTRYRTSSSSNSSLSNGLLENGHHDNGTELTSTPRRRNYFQVPISELLSFPRIQELTSSAEQISDALEAWSSIELSSDRTNAVFYDDTSSEEEEEEEEEERETAVADDYITYDNDINTEEEIWD